MSEFCTSTGPVTIYSGFLAISMSLRTGVYRSFLSTADPVNSAQIILEPESYRAPRSSGGFLGSIINSRLPKALYS